MKSVRKKALIAIIIEFFVFSFVGFSLVLMLFHAGILAFPVIAFMWTFWGFNVLTFFIGTEIKFRYKISFAVLNLLLVSLLIAFLINSAESTRNNTVQIVSIAVSIVVALLYLLVSILFVKHYWNPAKNEVLRLLGKNSPEPTAGQAACGLTHCYTDTRTGVLIENMKVYNYKSVKSIEKEGIIFSDGLKIIFQDCINGFKKNYNSFTNVSTCIAERNILVQPPYFQFYLDDMNVKIIFDCKGLFAKKRSIKLFQYFQLKIKSLGYKTFDLT